MSVVVVRAVGIVEVADLVGQVHDTERFFHASPAVVFDTVGAAVRRDVLLAVAEDDDALRRVRFIDMLQRFGTRFDGRIEDGDVVFSDGVVCLERLERKREIDVKVVLVAQNFFSGNGRNVVLVDQDEFQKLIKGGYPKSPGAFRIRGVTRNGASYTDV